MLWFSFCHLGLARICNICNPRFDGHNRRTDCNRAEEARITNPRQRVVRSEMRNLKILKRIEMYLNINFLISEIIQTFVKGRI